MSHTGMAKYPVLSGKSVLAKYTVVSGEHILAKYTVLSGKSVLAKYTVLSDKRFLAKSIFIRVIPYFFSLNFQYYQNHLTVELLLRHTS